MKPLMGICFCPAADSLALRGLTENWFLVSLMMIDDPKSGPVVNLRREFFIRIGVIRK
jgi:hypothetical protein